MPSTEQESLQAIRFNLKFWNVFPDVIKNVFEALTEKLFFIFEILIESTFANLGDRGNIGDSYSIVPFLPE